LIGHWQTLSAALFPPPPVHFQRARWETPDGDFIDVDFAGAPQLPQKFSSSATSALHSLQAGIVDF